MGELKRIEKVRTIVSGVSLIYFYSGEVVSIQWANFAEPDTVFAHLDDPAYSTKCRTADNGYALRWPDGMDWSAGAVFKSGKLLNPSNFDKPASSRMSYLPANSPGRQSGGKLDRRDHVRTPAKSKPSRPKKATTVAARSKKSR
ncbi:MAG: hypothetical protein R3F46_05420 [bacterium]